MQEITVTRTDTGGRIKCNMYATNQLFNRTKVSILRACKFVPIWSFMYVIQNITSPTHFIISFTSGWENKVLDQSGFYCQET